ncbi:MAG: S1-like domain-containing RNA-binding protein [Bacilli bacterium]
MKIGEIDTYEVLRETDLGYLLTDDGVNEIFLHRNETNFTSLRNGEHVDAFLYYDKLKRVAATLYVPYVTLSKGALCKCVNVTGFGAYFNIGIAKDMLLFSDDYLPEDAPYEGNKLPIKLRLSKSGLYAKLLNKVEMMEMNDGTTYSEKDEFTGYVYRITKDGINIVDEHFNIVFIYYQNLDKKYVLGESVSGFIIGVNEEDYYGTLVKSREEEMDRDIEIIEEYLKNHYGVMNYSSNTSPEVIKSVFKMSKSSFKKALGSLYKDEKVILEDDRTILRR